MKPLCCHANMIMSFIVLDTKTQANMDLSEEYAQLILKDGDLETNWRNWVDEKMQLVQPLLDELNEQ